MIEKEREKIIGQKIEHKDEERIPRVTKGIISLSIGGSVFTNEKEMISRERLERVLYFTKQLITDDRLRDYKFIIVLGGGVIARKYQQTIRDIIISDKKSTNNKSTGNKSREKQENNQENNQLNNLLDSVGIMITRSNAELLKALLKSTPWNNNDSNDEQNNNRTPIFEEIITEYEDEKLLRKFLTANQKIIIGGGWKPGFSTDFCAVKALTKSLRITTEKRGALINITNQEYVYDKNPSLFKDAKPLTRISWDDFKKLIPKEWSPGINLPFDPAASKLASEEGLSVIITSLEKAITKKEELINELIRITNNQTRKLKKEEIVGTLISDERRKQ